MTLLTAAQVAPMLEIADIAARVGERREYVRDKLIKRPDFPRPCLVLSQKIRKWDTKDIDTWLEKHKQKLAR